MGKISPFYIVDASGHIQLDVIKQTEVNMGKRDERVKPKTEERLKEILGIAKKLHWIYPKENMRVEVSYSVMQLSEVEKCMLAMVDELELKRLRLWGKDEI